MVPSEALASLGGVVLFAAPGAGLAKILPAIREMPTGRRLAYAWLLGVAWTAGWLYALSHWLAVPLRTPAIPGVAAVPVLAGGVSWVRRRKIVQIPPPLRKHRSLSGRIALAAGALISLALVCDAMDNPLTDWDGRMTWSAQARYVRDEGTVHPAALTQRGWYVSHPWYPLLMPVAQVAVLEVTHADPDHHAFRPLYAVFFPVWLLLIHGWAAKLTGRVTAGWSLRPSAGLAAGILLGAAVLTKAEGEILAPVALELALVHPWAQGGGRHDGASFGVTAGAGSPSRPCRPRSGWSCCSPGGPSFPRASEASSRPPPGPCSGRGSSPAFHASPGTPATRW